MKMISKTDHFINGTWLIENQMQQNRSILELVANRPVRKECQDKKDESTDSHHRVIFRRVNLSFNIE